VASHSYLGAVIFGLLACNTTYYIIAGRLSEALESVAWYVLLILFTLESVRGHRLRSARMPALIHGLRLLATLAIAVTAVLYVREKEWLDAANLCLWIAVVALLEIEVRNPAMITAHRKALTLTAAALYAALGILVLIWLAGGKWMNAWDAALWLAAFGILELDVLRTQEKQNNIV
jgi:hypothetical protein